MGKVKVLSLYNLKKEKGQYVSFGIILILTAFILNLALVLFFSVNSEYDKKFDSLNTADINFCIPFDNDNESLADECKNIKGVRSLERREGIFANTIVKEFRDTDFSMNTVFYNLDEKRSLNKLKITEQSEKDFVLPIYIPFYVAEFGQFELGDTIIYQVNGKDYSFSIQGIAEEMQYGNYGMGIMGAYLPEKSYNILLSENMENKTAEYSLIIDDGVDLQDVQDTINEILDGKNINLLSINNGSSGKQVRTMVSSLVILILIGFAAVILLVSMLLSKFRIQNSIEEEMVNMGVLKAIGYTGNMIIGATILPYIMVGLAASAAGVFLSYTLLPVMAKVLAMQSGFTFRLHFDIVALCLTIAILVVVTVLFTYAAARRIKKLVPINAIRGNSQSGRSGRNYFPLDKTRGSIRFNIILKQMASSAKQNVLLFFAAFMVMVLMAFAGTLFWNVVIKPDNFISTLSEEMPQIILKAADNKKEQLESKLEKEAGVKKLLEYSKEKVEYEDGSITAFICEDYSLVLNDLCYEGRNPKNENEIAIGSKLAEKYSIGDTIRITNGETSYDYKIVGFVQSINYQGEVCELTQEGYCKINEGYGFDSIYLYLDKEVNIGDFLEKIEKEHNDLISSSVNNDKMMQTTKEMFQSVVMVIIAAIFILTVLIVLLVLYIIIKSLIIRRKKEFGIYKAIGYSNMQLVIQIAGSFIPVSFAGVLSSALLGIIYMPAINDMIFMMVGAAKNNFQVSLGILLVFAVLQILVNFVISVALAMPIKKISAYSLYTS